MNQATEVARTRHGQTWVGLAFACALMAVAGVARAQETVMLGLQSEDGDDDLARELTEAVREQIQDLTTWQLADSRPSLLQMTMANDCDAKSDACLSKIASGLGASQLVLGTMKRVEGDRIRVNINLFDADRGERSASGEEQVAETDSGALAVVARSLVRQLAGIEEPAPEPMAPAPSAVPAPVSAPEQAEPGAVDEGWEQPAEGGSSIAWLGYALLGVAAVSTGMVVVSWIQIESASNDAGFEEYRRAAGENRPTATDVCALVDQQERFGGKVSPTTFEAARDQCNKGEAFEVLQYVFLGTAAVAGGIGLWLVLDDESDSGAASVGGPRLAVRPNVGTSSAGLTARLQF